MNEGGENAGGDAGGVDDTVEGVGIGFEIVSEVTGLDGGGAEGC